MQRQVLFRKLSRWVSDYGPLKLTIATTIVSVLLSVAINYGASLVFGYDMGMVGWLGSGLTPLIIAPLASYFPYKLMVYINQLEAQMRQLATVDALTQVMTRRAFLEHAEQHRKWAIRYAQGFAILMLDIDHFKKVNDTYGHAGGDQVLRSFGRTLAQTSRESDLVGRLGGEEFALLLPDASGETAQQFAQKLMQTLRADRVDLGQQSLHYSASIGICEFHPDTAQSLDHLLECADQALYSAKHQGRDRAVLYTAPAATPAESAP